MQSTGKRSRGSILLFVIALCAIATILLMGFLLDQSYNPIIKPSPNPTMNPNAGSVNQNVQSIQINQTVLVAPEFSVGGILTGVFACFASFAVFAVYKKQAK